VAHFKRVEAVVAHEYFITVRPRDMSRLVSASLRRLHALESPSFGRDMGSRTVKRYDDW